MLITIIRETVLFKSTTSRCFHHEMSFNACLIKLPSLINHFSITKTLQAMVIPSIRDESCKHHTCARIGHYGGSGVFPQYNSRNQSNQLATMDGVAFVIRNATAIHI
ncbi:hypothetical protein ACFX2J_010907 [Malus domestica]